LIRDGNDKQDYFSDFCKNISGEVYNVGSRPEWEMDIKGYSDLILKAVGRDDSIVRYEESEPFTTKIKRMDFSKAVRKEETGSNYSGVRSQEPESRIEEETFCHISRNRNGSSPELGSKAIRLI